MSRIEQKKVKRHGARMIKGLTADLYDEIPMVCREYISNAADVKAKTIHIGIVKPSYDSLIFSDDGIGMDESEIEDATNIMISNKIYDPKYPPIGRFGIGIYAGGKICSEIIIRTKKKDESTVRYAKIPIERWFEEGEKDLSKDITDVTIYEYEEVDIDPLDSEQIAKSYTIIELRHLKPFAKNYLKNNLDDLKKKLGFYAPIRFDYDKLKPLSPYDFETEKNSGIPEESLKIKLVNWIKKRVETNRFCEFDIAPQYNNLSVFLEEEEIFRLVPQKDYIHPHNWKETTIYDENGEPIAYAWAVLRDYAVVSKGTKTLHGLYKEQEFRGITLRLWNVAVLFPPSLQLALDLKRASSTFGRWWGEIYIMDKELKLNLARNKISTESKNWKTIKEQLVNWIKSLQGISEKKKREGKKETYERLDVFKERGLNPSNNYMRKLMEAAGLEIPTKKEEEKVIVVKSTKTDEIKTGVKDEVIEATKRDEIKAGVKDEVKEELAETLLIEKMQQEKSQVLGEAKADIKSDIKTEVKTLEHEEEKVELITEAKEEEREVDEEIEIKDSNEYANIIIERYGLLGETKTIIEEIGNLLNKEPSISWRKIFDHIDTVIENYRELHP